MHRGMKIFVQPVQKYSYYQTILNGKIVIIRLWKDGLLVLWFVK